MRRRFLFAHLALLSVLVIAAGCSDSATTTPQLSRVRAGNYNTLSDYIQGQIDAVLPKGFEDAVDARWSTVQSKKNAGDFAGAVKQFNTLAAWIDKKTNDITPYSGHSKQQDAALLVLNMARWLYQGEVTPVEPAGPDDVVEVVPAGTPATVVTPSTHAGMSFGPQAKDRVIIISEQTYPGICNGPLPTSRCQYPLFYKIESFPNERFANLAHFAVCMLTTGDRRPLDYPEDEVSGVEGPVHHRMRLAHNRPADPANETPGAIEEGSVEILPRSEHQQGFAHCDQHVDAFLPPMQKAMHAVLHFVERTFSPKSAMAYDQGPEHDGGITSDFNGLDPVSQPDLSVATFSAPADAFPGDPISVSYAVENKSRRSLHRPVEIEAAAASFDPGATAASQATSAAIYLYADAGLTQIAAGPFATQAIAAMAPDASARSFAPSITLPSDLAAGTYWLAVKVTPNNGDPNEGGITELDASNNVAATRFVVNSRAVKVLVLGNLDDENARVVAALTSRMPNVTFSANSNAGSLTASYLSQFKTVLLFESDLWRESQTVGNAIARYVRSGGNLVLGTFYWQNRSDNPRYPSNYGWGDLETLDPLQAPPGMGEPAFSNLYEYRSAELDLSSVITHPLTAGVNSVVIHNYPNGMEAKPGTSVVAWYKNGTPFISYLRHELGQRIVAVTTFPDHEHYGAVEGDFWRVWTNAIGWSAAGSTPAPAPAMASSTGDANPAAPADTTKIGGPRGQR